MPANCKAPGCKLSVPAELVGAGLCLMHFTLDLEQTCAKMRRETVLGKIEPERLEEILGYLGEHGELLARAATSGAAHSDEIKARILSTFLTLMNFREHLDRNSRRLATAGLARGGIR